MLRKLLILFLLTDLLLGCGKTTVDPNAPSATPHGEWTASLSGGGFNKFESFRNFQYTFEVTGANQPVTIRAASPDIKIQFALFNPNGTQIGTSGIDREVSADYKLNPGKHRVVVTADRQAIGTFDLSVSGLAVVRIPSQTLRSDTQNWGPTGGGGSMKTFKNHFYTFDVTDDNYSPDIDLQSSDTDVMLYLYDPQGSQIDFTVFKARTQYLVKLAKKGTYTVMVATAARSNVGNYELVITGKVDNLKRVESQVTTVTGRWPDKRIDDIYSFQLTPASSPIDIELWSPDINAYLELQTSAGSYIVNSGYSAKNQVIVRQDMAKNTYRIKTNTTTGPGNYTLAVTGQFTDFKKL
jgi:hypothetical protein